MCNSEAVENHQSAAIVGSGAASAELESLIRSAHSVVTQSEAMQTGKIGVYQFLRSLSVFSEIPGAELKNLADASRFVTFETGQFITVEGDEEGSYGFIIVSGRVAMLKTSINGKELIVELLQSKDIFGLLLTLATERLPASLSARCLQRTKVIWVPIKEFIRMLEAHPIVMKEFVAHLLISLQSSYELSRGLAHDRVDVRIAAVLASLAAKTSKFSPSHETQEIDFTRQQLADLTGTTAETAIRVTGAMRRDGLIDIKRPGTIGIRNFKALQKLADCFHLPGGGAVMRQVKYKENPPEAAARSLFNLS